MSEPVDVELLLGLIDLLHNDIRDRRHVQLADGIRALAAENERLRGLVQELIPQMEHTGNLLSKMEQTPEVDHCLTCMAVHLVMAKEATK